MDSIITDLRALRRPLRPEKLHLKAMGITGKVYGKRAG